jgi:urocanate hydratase
MLTDKQARLMIMLSDTPRSSGRLVVMGGVSRAGWPLSTYDEIHGIMRRLEDRDLVRRASSKPIVWELTHAGREALANDRRQHEE